jgi:uncharacterized protein
VTRRRFIALSALGLGGYATYGWWGSRGLREVYRTLALPRWNHADYRVSVISDLHAVQKAIAAKPDAIVIPGDFVHLMPEGDDYAHLRAALRPLADFGGPVVACLGNHDYNIMRQDKLLATLDRCGVRLLKNDVTRADGITFRGIDDALHGNPRAGAGGPRESENTIVLWHEPDMVERLEGKASLVVSGHSHGGQVCLPLGIALYTPYGARRYISGWYPEARTPLYVTQGVGVMRGFRYNCPPEVVVLTLTSKTDV